MSLLYKPNVYGIDHISIYSGITYVVCVSGGKKCSFFGKFGVPCFHETPDLKFALLPYYRRVLEAVISRYPTQNSVFPGKDIFIALKKLIKRTIPVTRNM